MADSTQQPQDEIDEAPPWDVDGTTEKARGSRWNPRNWGNPLSFFRRQPKSDDGTPPWDISEEEAEANAFERPEEFLGKVTVELSHSEPKEPSKFMVGLRRTLFRASGGHFGTEDGQPPVEQYYSSPYAEGEEIPTSTGEDTPVQEEAFILDQEEEAPEHPQEEPVAEVETEEAPNEAEADPTAPEPVEAADEEAPEDAPEEKPVETFDIPLEALENAEAQEPKLKGWAKAKAAVISFIPFLGKSKANTLDEEFEDNELNDAPIFASLRDEPDSPEFNKNLRRARAQIAMADLLLDGNYARQCHLNRQTNAERQRKLGEHIYAAFKHARSNGHFGGSAATLAPVNDNPSTKPQAPEQPAHVQRPRTHTHMTDPGALKLSEYIFKENAGLELKDIKGVTSDGLQNIIIEMRDGSLRDMKIDIEETTFKNTRELAEAINVAYDHMIKGHARPNWSQYDPGMPLAEDEPELQQEQHNTPEAAAA